MNNPFNDYLGLLNEMRTELSKLSDLEMQKSKVVQHNDLMELDRIMKLEQAAALRFRGLEQKQTTLLTALDLKGVSLSALPGHFPPELRLEAKNSVEQLKTQYQIYRTSSEAARNTLESSLHFIDGILANQGAQADKGPGYESPDPQIPKKMKTDFRA